MSIFESSFPRYSRRRFLGAASLAAVGLTQLPFLSRRAASAAPSGPVDIGSRLELFIDEHLVEDRTGVDLRLHHPTPAELVLVHDAPWEGSGSGYHSVFHDGEKFRMYYKAWHLEVTPVQVNTERHPLYCCYAESSDGIHWIKPKLGLHEFEGSKQNNITIDSGPLGALNIDAGHPAVFLDANPAAPPEGRFKAVVRSPDPHGLVPLQSADGLRWSAMTGTPILIDQGAFDSQNLAFWDPHIEKYRAYWRIFTEGVTRRGEWKPAGHRAIRTATSDDLIHWSDPEDLTYEDSPSEHLYTNQVLSYPRAPHLLLGFPSRYIERGWSESMRALPEREHREMRSAAMDRYGMALTEGLLMASRDGVRFNRWNEAFLRPGIERPGTWAYGNQFIAWGLVETPSALPGAPNELSLYAAESYWTDASSALRRYILRLDGFVSAAAGMEGGTITTRPIRFEGTELRLNLSTSAAGGIRVEILSAEGGAVPGFGLEDCEETFGDSIERRVVWMGDPDLGALAGKAVRLRFHLRDADLYAYRFAV